MLLRGGIVLVHDDKNHINSIKADILIEGDAITKIEADILASAGTRVINYTDNILIPGFINTHYHVWQILLKGRHGNKILLDYFVSGNSTPIETFHAHRFIRELHVVSSYCCKLLLGTTW
jgi:cytosine/adenosine deaminase-related metal-dependent hydrolase